MWTFPGGVFESDDGPVPAEIDEDTQHWGDPELLSTAANAALRETHEETALICERSAMVWFSHWIPPKVGPPKRFATWFFVAPEHHGEIVVDTAENDEARWLSAAAALDLHARGDFPMAVPTWITLDDLTAADSVGALMNEAATQGARQHQTRSFTSESGRIVCWEGDAAYESGDADAPGARNRALVDDRMQIVERIRG